VSYTRTVRWGIALALCAAAFYLGTLTGCVYARETYPADPPAQCVEAAHDYRLTPDGRKWYLDCVNRN
jgi:hypothetical protein